MKKFLILFVLSATILLLGWNQEIPRAKMENGKKAYDKYCLSCHMSNGEGVPRMTPSLVKSKYVSHTKTQLIRIILLGSEALAGEPQRVYKNIMAPLDNMTDQEISDAATYVRNSFGNKGTMITPGDVKYVRARIH